MHLEWRQTSIRQSRAFQRIATHADGGIGVCSSIERMLNVVQPDYYDNVKPWYVKMKPGDLAFFLGPL